MVRRGGSAPPASAMSVRRSAIDLPARECRALCAAMKWRPRMDSHHQPPDSKSGAPLIELQG